jgi:alkanesulfonate monooxygenase SsuD/methylene tetrahydromethanopterin reductase-like flavin-dependent oxidoreductase (luciferase family)
VTSVMVAPHRPAMPTAKILSMIDVLSKGQLTVGVARDGWGRSSRPSERTLPGLGGLTTDEMLNTLKRFRDEVLAGV